MKSLNLPNPLKTAIRQLFPAIAAVAAFCGSLRAQTTHVGGNGVIGDETLAVVADVATVPRGGVHWTAAGGDGNRYSRLSSPIVTVPNTGAVTLKFTHRYFFEDTWDGGVVDVSINGAPAAYLPSGAITTNGYSPSAMIGNVFTSGEKTFTGKSAGYDGSVLIESIVNLGSLNAGDTVSVTFRGGWDDAYVEPGTDWQIGTVSIEDALATSMLNVDFINGSGGFTVVSDAGLTGQFIYPGPKSRFEIDGDLLTADRFVPDVPGATTVIDINHTDLSVVLLAGTLEPGDSFTLFDLTGGTTISGNPDSMTLPPGTWDLTNLNVSGTIVFRADSKILDFTFPTFGPATINQAAKTIKIFVPDGTVVTALSPDFTLSDGASCTVSGNPVVSGATLDFTNPVHYVVTGSDGISTTDYTVTVDFVPVENTVIWNIGSGTWDVSTFNWLGQISGLPTVFTNGGANHAIFNKIAGGDITVSPDMAPLSTTVSATSGTYTIHGGSIAGAGPFTKSGAGSLVLSAANTYTGKTVIQEGTVQLGIFNTGSFGLSIAGSPGPLGAPTGDDATIDIHNGVTLQTGNTNPRVDQVTDRNINLASTAPGTVTIRVNDNDTNFTFGAVTATGTGAKTLALFTGSPNGNGDRESVIFNGPISDSSDNSPTSLNFRFHTQTGSESYISLKEGGTFTGPITLVRSNANNAYFVVGGVRTRNTNVPGSGQLGGGTYAGAISLDTNVIFYYNSSANQTLSGEISGAGKLTKEVAGSVLTLTGSNSYGGVTTVSGGTLLVDGTNSGSGAVNVASAATFGGIGSVGGNVTFSAGALASFTQGSPMAIGGTLTLNNNIVHLALPPNLGAGTYTLATYNDGGSSGAFDATPVVDSGSLAGGATATIETLGGTVSLIVAVGGSDYDTWAGPSGFNLTGGIDDDDDGDGVSNREEYAFGLNPTSGASVSPIVVPLDPATGTFSYTRREPTLATDVVCTVWTSTDLEHWTEDTGAVEGIKFTVDEVQTVPITLSATPVDGRLFVQVRADDAPPPIE